MGNNVSLCEAPPAEATAVEEEVAADPAEEAPAEEEEAPAEEEEAPAPEVKVGSVPLDYRFPAVNQARTCYTHYNEFYKCIEEGKDENSEECKYHKRFYRAICPNEWVENWDGLREEGNWYGKY